MQTPPPGMTGEQREHMEQDNTGNAVADGPTALSDIFTPAPPPEPQTEQAGQAEPQAAPEAAPEKGEPSSEQPRDEAGKFAPKAAAPPAAEKNAEEGRISAVKAEREQRQAAQRELEAARRELAELRARVAPQAPPAQHAPQQTATPPVPLSDMLFQDPDGFVRQVQQSHEQALRDTRIALSEAMVRQQFPDYPDAEAALERYALSSPAAREEVARLLNSHPAPAMVAYQAGKHLLAQQQWQPLMQQHKTPDAFIAAEVERRVQEKLAEQAQQSVPSNPARLPASLAGARASQGRTASNYAGPPALSEILGPRR
jgi:hypothetical protein